MEEYLKKYVDKEHLEEAIERLKKGEPVQYIIGNVNFYGNFIEVNKNVLIPRFETEELVEKTIQKIHQKFDSKIDILDLCTGSGCIAITLQKELNCNVVASDISSSALDVAKKNAVINKVDITFYESDLFKNIKGRFDVIISNPPYIAYNEKIDEIVYHNEPHLALFADNDGLSFYESILKDSSHYLKKDFLIAFEIGYLQGEKVTEIARKYLGDVMITVEKDLQNRERFVFIESENRP